MYLEVTQTPHPSARHTVPAGIYAHCYLTTLLAVLLVSHTVISRLIESRYRGGRWGTTGDLQPESRGPKQTKVEKNALTFCVGSQLCFQIFILFLKSRRLCRIREGPGRTELQAYFPTNFLSDHHVVLCWLLASTANESDSSVQKNVTCLI